MRVETFTHEDGLLVRTVVPDRGTPYRHRCTLRVFKTVCHHIDERGIVALFDVVFEEKVPFTQTAVALGFLKERGIIVAGRGFGHGPKKSVPAEGCRLKQGGSTVTEHGLCEWFALFEETKGETNR